MSLKRLVAASGLTFAAILSIGLSAGVAAADTTGTPVGTLTATQVDGPCNDLGADVTIAVAGGFADTAYTATGGGVSTAAHFTTNSAGSGSDVVRNVLPPGGWTGTGTITVSANGTTGRVAVAIACVDPRGK
jgi:hypothetical protein